MDNKKIFENYLTNHYAATDKTDFTNKKAPLVKTGRGYGTGRNCTLHNGTSQCTTLPHLI